MSNRKKQLVEQDLSLVEVKSKFEAEFRRFSLKRDVCKEYVEFKELLQRTHLLDSVGFSIYYRHPQDGDLLPINNTENFLFALGTAAPLLRLFLQRGDHAEPNEANASKKLLPFGGNQQTVVNKRLQISTPQDFRRVSQIIDVDILPETVRRVRLCKHNSDKPLGFYIRDGTSLRVTTEGLERVPGIFVSRLVPGGLAGSTGLLSVNDEVLEVNGIEVSGKSLDQVTEMMVANSQNLIVTVKPVHSNNNGSTPSTPSIKGVGPNDQRPPKAKDIKASPLATSGYSARNRDDDDDDEEDEEDEDEDEEEYEDEDEMDSEEEGDEPVVKDGVVHV